jgi:SNF2 family DNA or RNA helicase
MNDKEKKVSEEIHSLIPISGVSLKKGGAFSHQLMDNNKGLLIAFLRAKQSCIIPLLMGDVVKRCVRKGKISKDYLEYLEYNSKMNVVISTILDRANNQKGKIVFCHYHLEIDYISKKLIENGMSVMIFDGRCQGKDRKLALSKKYDVLILQIQCGSEGLNLQEHYSEVYFVSPHWNPSVEDQAIARCHRMGQKEEVMVFKFIMEKFDNCDENIMTLENYIYELQGLKREYRNEILGC